MPKLEYFLVAEGVSIDQATNRISIFNVIEELAFPTFPYVFPQPISAVSCWNRQPSDEDIDYQLLLRVHRPAGQGTPPEFPINFKLKAERHRIVHRIGAAKFEEAGEYVFEILLNNKHIASHTIIVKKLASSFDTMS